VGGFDLYLNPESNKFNANIANSNGLTSYWNFNGGSGNTVQDTSGKGKAGRQYNDAKFVTR